MRLSRPQRRDAGDENIVPLINIVFLLLVFFILTGTLEPAEPLAVEPPVSTAAGPLEEEGVTILLDKDGTMALDNEVLSLNGILSRIEPRRDLDIRIKADGASTTEMLLPLMNALRDAGIERVILVTAAKVGG